MSVQFKMRTFSTFILGDNRIVLVVCSIRTMILPPMTSFILPIPSNSVTKQSSQCRQQLGNEAQKQIMGAPYICIVLTKQTVLLVVTVPFSLLVPRLRRSCTQLYNYWARDYVQISNSEMLHAIRCVNQGVNWYVSFSSDGSEQSFLC